MTYSVRDNPDGERFEIVSGDGDVVGIADYSRDGDVVAITHTEVSSEAGGQGVGTALVVGALDIVRSRGEQVLPLCPFVPKVIAEHPDLLDLVPADERARFGLA